MSLLSQRDLSRPPFFSVIAHYWLPSEQSSWFMWSYWFIPFTCLLTVFPLHYKLLKAKTRPVGLCPPQMHLAQCLAHSRLNCIHSTMNGIQLNKYINLHTVQHCTCSTNPSPLRTFVFLLVWPWNSSQSVVPQSAAAASAGNVLEI